MEISDPPNRELKPKYWYAPLVIIIFSLLSACVTLKDPEGFQIHQDVVVGKVDSRNSFGQSFVSRRGSLNGIDLWLSIDPESQERSGTILIALYPDSGRSKLLASVPLSFSDIAQSDPVYIPLPSQTTSPGQDYYLRMSVDKGSVQVLGRAEDAYTQGTAYQSDQPVAADAAFRLSYDYGLSAMMTDLGRFAFDSWLLFPLLLVLFLPGWLLMDLAGIGKDFDFGARVAISLGISLATIPILMTWTSLLGFGWQNTNILIIAGLASAFAFWRIWDRKAWRHLRVDWYGVSLIAIFIFSLAVRLVMVRDLFAPAWVDSVHHGVITRLILEEGGFPDNYAPYLAIDSANYHPGFHSVLATFLWLSGLDIQSGMLAMGQVLNALMIFGTYLLAVSLSRSRSVGVIAALITGLVTPMPAYYSSWGRYTQLTGLLILPVAFVFIKRGYTLQTDLFSERLNTGTTKPLLTVLRGNWSTFLLAGIGIGGLFLTHYRVSAFLLCLVIADLIIQTKPRIKKGAKLTGFIWLIVYLLSIGVIGILLIAPWIPSTLSTLLIPKIQAWQGGSISLFDGFSWIFLNAALGRYVMVISALGLILALFKRRWFSLTLVLWFLMLFTLANLAYWGLPGGILINNLSVEIMLFLPISILGGYLVSEMLKAGMLSIPLDKMIWYQVVVGLTALIIGIIGARQLIPLLNPITFLYREADTSALNWLEKNIPEENTILINPFAWGYGLYAGQDGGYWASPIAGHITVPPPVLYGLSNTPEDTQQVNNLVQLVIENGDDAETLYHMMMDAGIQYLYTGVRGGVISPQALIDSPLFELLYQEDGARAFRAIDTP